MDRDVTARLRPRVPSDPPPAANSAPHAPTAIDRLPAWAQGPARRGARWLPLAGFAAGFLWDALSYRRIDRLGDNLSLLAYLTVLGAMIALSIRVDRNPTALPRIAARRPWLDTLVQFCFGGLYPVYVIYYFKSATWGPTLLFLVPLVGLLLANQFLDHRLRHDRVRLLLFELCAFSFLLFFIPVVTGFAGTGIFALAGLASLGATAIVALGAYVGGPHPLVSELRTHVPAWFLLLGGLWLLDALGWIPPVPLALMGGGIYHDVHREKDGFHLTWEKPPWYRPFLHDDRQFHFRDGDRVFCFSPIFAPTGMAVHIVHVWERWDAEAGWVEMNRIPFDVEGGREGGYRGYTAKRHVQPGDWRVRVVTGDDRELGRYRLVVDEGTSEGAPTMVTAVDR